MPTLRPIEILLIVLVVLLLFGAKRLPDLARSVGKSLKILKTEVKDLGDDHPPSEAIRPQVLPGTDGQPVASGSALGAPTTPHGADREQA